MCEPLLSPTQHFVVSNIRVVRWGGLSFILPSQAPANEGAWILPSLNLTFAHLNSDDRTVTTANSSITLLCLQYRRSEQLALKNHTNCPQCRGEKLGEPQEHPPSPVCPQAKLPSSFNQKVLVDTTPLPDDIPKVEEIGASSAPLMSASYFIGARCKDYNDDFMKCKTEANGKGEIECLKEGRKVTRCAASVYVQC